MIRMIKPKLFIILTFLLLMLFAWPVSAVGDVVLSVEVTGNEKINDDQILRAITNIRLGEPLNQTSVIQDRQAIMNLGYFSMVEPYTEEFLGGVKVVFKVIENPTIKEFKVEGLERIKPEEVTPFLTQKPGEVFNFIKTMNDLVMAQQYFNEEKGLLIPPLRGDASEINGLMEIDPEGLVTLHLYEARLGKVIFKGLEKTQEFVVARQISLKEGEILDFNQLREDVQQLARLQLFEDINPRLQPTSNPKMMDLVMEFKEGENRQLSLGVTYTPVDNQLLGSVGVVDPNLMGLGQRLSFNMELNPNNVFNLNFEFYEPWLDTKETSLGLKLFSNHTLSLSGTEKIDGENPDNQYTFKYNEKRTGLNLTLGRPLERNLRVDTSFQMERVTIDPKEWVPLKTNTYEPDADKTLDYPSVALNTYQKEYWNNSLGLGLSYNKLLYTKTYTTGGYWANLGFNLHGGIFGGDYDYQHLYGEYKQFYSPFTNTTLGYRIRGGKLLGSPPDSSKLYLGGELSLRGYDIRHIEGDQQVLANVELRQRIPNTENLEAVLFYDLGTVDFDRYYQSYGVGFRYNIPLLGQLRFDFAWTPEGGKPKFNFFFGEMF